MLCKRLQEKRKQFWDEIMTQLTNSSLIQHRLQHRACWQNNEQWIKEANHICPVATNIWNVYPCHIWDLQPQHSYEQRGHCFSSIQVLRKPFALVKMLWLPASAGLWDSRIEWNTQRWYQLRGSLPTQGSMEGQQLEHPHQKTPQAEVRHSGLYI